MTKIDKTVLVLGATGQQGGAVARALLENGWQVRALVRSPQGDAARRLAAAGAEIVVGDLRHEPSLREAAKGAHGLFSVLPSSGQPEYGVSDADELQLGVAVANAAQQAGVEHLVYSSIAGAGPDTGVGHFGSKWQVEQHIRSLPLDSTILRPTAFMEILLLPAFGLASGTLSFFQYPEQSQQFIAAEDIGHLAAAVFADRPTHRNTTFDIAGDSLTGLQLAEQITQAVGRAISYQRFPDAVIASAPMLEQIVALVDSGKAAGSADLARLRGLHPGLLTFAQWLARSGAAAIREI